MNYVYFITIGIFGLLLLLSPERFMGKAKYTEEGVKSQGLMKKVGIGIIVFSIVMILITYLR